MNLVRLAQGILLSIFVVLFLGVLIYSSKPILATIDEFLQWKAAETTASMYGSVQQSLPKRDWQVQSLDFGAKSVSSVETNFSDPDRVLFVKNSQIQLAIASLTKLMTAMIVIDNYNLSKIITVSKKADSQQPLKQDVKMGDSMSVENFLDIMLMESSNKAAYTLAEELGEEKFVGMMNQKAKYLSLENTFFADFTGLSSQNISTAEDLTTLAEYILKNYPKIAEITSKQEFELPNYGKITNSNQLLNQVPEIVAGKTGFTTDAKGCLLLVVNNLQNNDYLIYIILGSEDRFSDMKKLIDWTNTAYKWEK